MTDTGTGTVQPPEGTLVFVPKGHGFYVFPITDDPNDDGAKIIDQAIALHHVTESLDNGELSPLGYDGYGAAIYAHQQAPDEDG